MGGAAAVSPEPVAIRALPEMLKDAMELQAAPAGALKSMVVAPATLEVWVSPWYVGYRRK